MNHVTHPSTYANISISSLEISKFSYIKKTYSGGLEGGGVNNVKCCDSNKTISFNFNENNLLRKYMKTWKKMLAV